MRLCGGTANETPFRGLEWALTFKFRPSAKRVFILITDDVYAPFVEGFRSLASVAPRNTILLYSFSKYWGATGLRLALTAAYREPPGVAAAPPPPAVPDARIGEPIPAR